jgi:hypothetical protein
MGPTVLAVIAGLVGVGAAFKAASITHPPWLILLGVLPPLPLVLCTARMAIRRARAVTA